MKVPLGFVQAFLNALLLVFVFFPVTAVVLYALLRGVSNMMQDSASQIYSEAVDYHNNITELTIRYGLHSDAAMLQWFEDTAFRYVDYFMSSTVAAIFSHLRTSSEQLFAVEELIHLRSPSGAFGLADVAAVVEEARQFQHPSRTLFATTAGKLRTQHADFATDSTVYLNAQIDTVVAVENGTVVHDALLVIDPQSFDPLRDAILRDASVEPSVAAVVKAASFQRSDQLTLPFQAYTRVAGADEIVAGGSGVVGGWGNSRDGEGAVEGPPSPSSAYDVLNMSSLCAGETLRQCLRAVLQPTIAAPQAALRSVRYDAVSAVHSTRLDGEDVVTMWLPVPNSYALQVQMFERCLSPSQSPTRTRTADDGGRDFTTATPPPPPLPCRLSTSVLPDPRVILSSSSSQLTAPATPPVWDAFVAPSAVRGRPYGNHSNRLSFGRAVRRITGPRGWVGSAIRMGDLQRAMLQHTHRMVSISAILTPSPEGHPRVVAAVGPSSHRALPVMPSTFSQYSRDHIQSERLQTAIPPPSFSFSSNATVPETIVLMPSPSAGVPVPVAYVVSEMHRLKSFEGCYSYRNAPAFSLNRGRSISDPKGRCGSILMRIPAAIWFNTTLVPDGTRFSATSYPLSTDDIVAGVVARALFSVPSPYPHAYFAISGIQLSKAFTSQMRADAFQTTQSVLLSEWNQKYSDVRVHLLASPLRAVEQLILWTLLCAVALAIAQCVLVVQVARPLRSASFHAIAAIQRDFRYVCPEMETTHIEELADVHAHLMALFTFHRHAWRLVSPVIQMSLMRRIRELYVTHPLLPSTDASAPKGFCGMLRGCLGIPVGTRLLLKDVSWGSKLAPRTPVHPPKNVLLSLFPTIMKGGAVVDVWRAELDDAVYDPQPSDDSPSSTENEADHSVGSRRSSRASGVGQSLLQGSMRAEAAHLGIPSIFDNVTLPSRGRGMGGARGRPVGRKGEEGDHSKPSTEMTDELHVFNMTVVTLQVTRMSRELPTRPSHALLIDGIAGAAAPFGGVVDLGLVPDHPPVFQNNERNPPFSPVEPDVVAATVIFPHSACPVPGVPAVSGGGAAMATLGAVTVAAHLTHFLHTLSAEKMGGPQLAPTVPHPALNTAAVDALREAVERRGPVAVSGGVVVGKAVVTSQPAQSRFVVVRSAALMQFSKLLARRAQLLPVDILVDSNVRKLVGGVYVCRAVDIVSVKCSTHPRGSKGLARLAASAPVDPFQVGSMMQSPNATGGAGPPQSLRAGQSRSEVMDSHRAMSHCGRSDLSVPSRVHTALNNNNAADMSVLWWKYAPHRELVFQPLGLTHPAATCVGLSSGILPSDLEALAWMAIGTACHVSAQPSLRPSRIFPEVSSPPSQLYLSNLHTSRHESFSRALRHLYNNRVCGLRSILSSYFESYPHDVVAKMWVAQNVGPSELCAKHLAAPSGSTLECGSVSATILTPLRFD